MPSRKSHIEMALHDWLTAALADQFAGTVVAYEDDGAPDPGSVRLPYVTLLLVSRKREGRPTTEVVEVGGQTVTRSVSRYTGRVRISVIGSSNTVSAWDVSERIEESITDPRIQLILSGAERPGVPATQPFAAPVESITEALEVTANLSTGSETRIVQDFRFSAAICREDDAAVDVIECVITSGTIGDITINTQTPEPNT